MAEEKYQRPEMHFEPGPLGSSPIGKPEPNLIERLDRCARWYETFPEIPDALFIAENLRKLSERAEFLGAKSGEDFKDKQKAWEDAELERIQREREEANPGPDWYYGP